MNEEKNINTVTDNGIDYDVQGENQADFVENEIFESKESAQKTGSLIKAFVQSYEENKKTMPLDLWLKKEFQKYPEVWQNKEDIVNTADEIIETVKKLNKNKEELYAHLESGKSRERYIVTKLEEGAKSAGITNVGEYAAKIDKTLDLSNQAMIDAVTTQSGNVNMIPTLDGFIAEQHHVNTFNINAEASGSSFRANVVPPKENGLYSKNGVDIVIKDTRTGKIVRRYQSKYGEDAEATQKLFDKGNYVAMGKLVPENQSKDIPNSTEVIEAGGVESKPLSKSNAKKLQEEFQKEQRKQEQKLYEWSDVNKVRVAKSIGKQALISAGITAAFQGGRILGRRVWNFITGKENPPASEDMKEFFESSLKSTTNVGVQVAVSGGVVVAAKNGWIKLLKNTPAGKIAEWVYVGMENCKIIYKMFKGEIGLSEGLDAMGNVTSSTIGGFVGATKGMALGATWGATLGTAVPVIGNIVGTAVGGFVGAVCGGIAGSTVGEAIYETGKAIVKGAVKIVKSAWETAKSVASELWEGTKAVCSALNPFNLF